MFFKTWLLLVFWLRNSFSLLTLQERKDICSLVTHVPWCHFLGRVCIRKFFHQQEFVVHPSSDLQFQMSVLESFKREIIKVTNTNTEEKCLGKEYEGITTSFPEIPQERSKPMSIPIMENSTPLSNYLFAKLNM